jgi:MFS family permease
MQFYDPMLSTHLVEMGVKPALSGYGFTTNCLVYSFGSLGMGILCTKWERRYVLLLSCAICAVSLYIMAPSAIIGLPNETWLIFVGLGLLGVGVAGLTVPIMPEMVESVMEDFGLTADEGADDDSENSEEEETDPVEAEICDRASTIYNMAYAMGCGLAPVLGGYINGKVGFRECVTTFAFACTCLFVFYLIAGVLCHKKTDLN